MSGRRWLLYYGRRALFNHVPTMTGGVGRAALTVFYRNHFIFANPADTKLELLSRTTGVDRVIDGFLYRFTHNRVVDWLFVPRPVGFVSPPRSDFPHHRIA